MECQYCKNTFKTNSNLIMHQKRAKYCLNIRNQENNSKFICLCSKTYTSKENLEYHQKKCKVDEIETLKHTINKIENTIKDLQYRIQYIAEKAIERTWQNNCRD